MTGFTETSRYIPSSFIIIIIIVFNYINCTPQQTIHKETPGRSARFVEFNSKTVKSETQKLEVLLFEIKTNQTNSTDTTLSEEKVLIDLFELTIHKSNAEPDYKKAYEYAESLYKSGTKDKLYYLNWGRILKSYFTLTTQKDSLEQEINNIIENKDSLENTSQKRSIKINNLKTIVEDQKKTIEEQSIIIVQQKETIEKLKKLDIMMEKQRSKIE